MYDFWIAVKHLWPVLMFLAALVAAGCWIAATDPYPRNGEDEERDGRWADDW